jgi:hypothetical protein
MGLAMSSNINWNEDKKARGLDDYDLGEVLEIQGYVVVTQKGILDKDNFYLPDKHGRQIYGHNV